MEGPPSVLHYYRSHGNDHCSGYCPDILYSYEENSWYQDHYCNAINESTVRIARLNQLSTC